MSIDDFIIQCCICNKYAEYKEKQENKDRTYYTPTQKEQENIKQNYKISHTYCPPCRKQYIKDNNLEHIIKE